MNRLKSKRTSLARRKNRIRQTISGDVSRPRLSVTISHKHVVAQIIDDNKQLTLAYVTTAGQKDLSANLTQRAKWVGAEVAKAAKKSKIKSLVVDRNGRKYHGRLKALADAARNEGIGV
jgi:large subunit ribosomal protein L18